MENLSTINNFFSDNTGIIIRYINNQDDLELHKHEFHELVIILKGQGIHITKREKYPIQTGDVFLVHPLHSHGYIETDQLELVNIIYLPKALKMPMLDLRNIPGYHALFELEPKMRRQHHFKSKLNLSLEELKLAKELVRKIADELKNENSGFQFLCLALFMQLLTYLSRCYSHSESKQARVLFQIGELLSYLEKNYAEPITLEQMTERANMSKSTLNRIFRKTTGDSPVDYLVNLRINKASSLMRNSELHISEVAYKTGFIDSNYFTRQFKKITGLSPREYRKKFESSS